MVASSMVILVCAAGAKQTKGEAARSSGRSLPFVLLLKWQQEMLPGPAHGNGYSFRHIRKIAQFASLVLGMKWNEQEIHALLMPGR